MTDSAYHPTVKCLNRLMHIEEFAAMGFPGYSINMPIFVITAKLDYVGDTKDEKFLFRLAEDFIFKGIPLPRSLFVTEFPAYRFFWYTPNELEGDPRKPTADNIQIFFSLQDRGL